MSDAQYVVVAIIGGLGAVAFFLIKSWARSWADTLTDHDKRLGEHDIQIATITADMRHIRDTADETREDVKQLLRNNYASRNTS